MDSTRYNTSYGSQKIYHWRCHMLTWKKMTHSAVLVMYHTVQLPNIDWRAWGILHSSYVFHFISTSTLFPFWLLRGKVFPFHFHTSSHVFQCYKHCKKLLHSRKTQVTEMKSLLWPNRTKPTCVLLQNKMLPNWFFAIEPTWCLLRNWLGKPETPACKRTMKISQS